MDNKEKLVYLQNLWIGKKVISISNSFQTNSDDVSLYIGEIVDVIPITKSETPVPVVKFDGYDESFISFSTIIEYTDNLWASLNKLSPEERWDLIQAFVFRFN